MGEHLNKIEDTRKKKQKMMEDKIKKSKSFHNWAMQQQK